MGNFRRSAESTLKLNKAWRILIQFKLNVAIHFLKLFSAVTFQHFDFECHHRRRQREIDPHHSKSNKYGSKQTLAVQNATWSISKENLAQPKNLTIKFSITSLLMRGICSASCDGDILCYECQLMVSQLNLSLKGNNDYMGECYFCASCLIIQFIFLMLAIPGLFIIDFHLFSITNIAVFIFTLPPTFLWLVFQAPISMQTGFQ